MGVIQLYGRRQHPMHLHQTQLQVVEKRLIDFNDSDENGIPDDTNGDGVITYGYGTTDFSHADIWIGDRVPIAPEQTGRQDTVSIAPGEMVSIAAQFNCRANTCGTAICLRG